MIRGARPATLEPQARVVHVEETSASGLNLLSAAHLAMLIAVAAAILCYLPALRDGFALDDTTIVRDNLRIHALRTIPQALTIPYWYEEGHLYRPLTTLSFGIEWAVGGGRPLVFHLVNLVWHAVVTALVVQLALRWWRPVEALIAGLWFAVHSVHAEAVANIVGRSELVCAAALLGIAVLASRGPAQRAPDAERRDWWYTFALACLAMGSKEIGAVAPVVAWVVACTPATHGTDRDTARVWRLTGAAAAGVAVLLAARLTVLGSLAGDAPHYAFTLVHGVHALALALATAPTAVGLMLVPQAPRLDYSPPESAIFHPSAVMVAVGCLLVLAAGVACSWHARRPNRWTMAACISAATYAPVSNLFVHSGIIVADRTLYSASIGVALLAGAAIGAAWRVRRWTLVGGAALVTATGAVLAVSSLGAWHDSRSAFEAIRDRSPTSFIGHYMVAKVRDVDGDPSGARLEYEQAVALTPHNAPLLYMAGANALRVHDSTAAIHLIDRAVALDPAGERARTALVVLTLSHGDTTRAQDLLRTGLTLDPAQRTWRGMLQSIGSATPGTIPH